MIIIYVIFKFNHWTLDIFSNRVYNTLNHSDIMNSETRKKCIEMIKPKINYNKEEIIGELMGLFAGDGNYFKTKNYHHRVFLFFGPDEGKFREEVYDVLFILFNKYAIKLRRKNLLILLYISRDIIDFIHNYLEWDKDLKKTYSVKLINQKYSKEFKIGFVRGSVDSDGHVSKKVKKINFASVSEGLINNIKQFLEDLDIEFHIHTYSDKRENRKPVHHINVKSKHYCKFIELIKPRNVK